MSLSWKNVDLLIPHKNKSLKVTHLNLLKNCSGEVKHGELFAIMGPSGGGKTTLLNALFGKIPKGTISEGKILYNNEERELYQWIGKVGFVDQDDVVNEDFTVKETLKFAAHLRLDRKKCFKEFKNLSFDRIVNQKVEKIVEILDLNRFSKTKLIKISGGERKRVMIGIELIADPEIIMLDEPTIGLDSVTALSLINLLRELANSQKKIVIVTIHQPSLEIFNLFNKVLILANGISVFNGKISEVDDFLLRSNFSKKEGMSTPELLLKMCEDIENVEENNKQYSILNTSCKDKTSFPRKKNDIYFKKSLDPYIIWVLIFREFMIISKRKWKFTKLQSGLIIMYTFLSYIAFIYDSIFDSTYEGLQKIASQGRLLPSLMNHSSYNEIIVKLAYKALLITYLLFSHIPIYIIQTWISASTFLKRWDIMKRESAVGTYSITSIYLSFLIFQIIIATIPTILYFIIVFAFTRKIFGWFYITSFIMMNFISVTIGLCVGAAFTKVFGTILLKSIFSCVVSCTFDLMKAHFNNFIRYFTQNDGVIKICNKALKIFCIMPSLSHFNLIKLKLFNVSKDIFSSLGILTDEQSENYTYELLGSKNYLLNIEEYAFGLKATTKNLYLIIFLTTTIFSLLGYFFLGMNLSPDVRMKLEEKNERND